MIITMGVDGDFHPRTLSSHGPHSLEVIRLDDAGTIIINIIDSGTQSPIVGKLKLSSEVVKQLTSFSRPCLSSRTIVPTSEPRPNADCVGC